MDELQTAAANTALQKMFKGNHFDICTIRKILDITGGQPTSYDMGVLGLLHCVDYADMLPEVRAELPNVLGRVLGSESIQFGIKPPALEVKSSANTNKAHSMLKSLCFWKQP